MLKNAGCPLDAGVPSDFTDWPTTPDNSSQAPAAPNAAAQKMIADMKWCLEGIPVTPDKTGVAECLAILGYTSADIIENIDEVMRGLS